MSRAAVFVPLLVVALLAGCAATSIAQTGAKFPSPAYPFTVGSLPPTITGFEQNGDPPRDSRHATTAKGTIKHVVWIFFENHGYNQVRNVGEFKRLADTYGEATNFFAHTHPSQPNYIYATAGQQCGITSNALSTCSAARTSIHSSAGPRCHPRASSSTSVQVVASALSPITSSGGTRA